MTIEPAILAFALFVSVGLASLLWRRTQGLTTDLVDRYDRAWAIRSHREGQTHGQIAEELGRDPAELAAWLAGADRTGG